MSLLAGKRDRLIIVERDEGNSTNALNEPVEDWQEFRRTWAEVVPVQGDEILKFNRAVGQKVARFTTLFDSAISTTDRISCGGETWQIFYLREIGRRAGLEIMAEVFV